MTRPSPKSQNSPPIQAGSHNEGSVPTRKRFTAVCKTTVRPRSLPSNNRWKSLTPVKLQVVLSTVSFGVIATRPWCPGSAVHRGKRPLAQTFRFRGIQWGLQNVLPGRPPKRSTRRELLALPPRSPTQKKPSQHSSYVGHCVID